MKDLKSDSYYSIYVVAMNDHGQSLASLVLLVHTPERDEIYNETVEGIFYCSIIKYTNKQINTVVHLYYITLIQLNKLIPIV